jgi:hypothetical protein
MTLELVQAKYLGTNPAAGVEISETVPAGASWGLLAATFTNVQAGVGTPQPMLIIDDGTDVLFETLAASAAQAISTTCRYNFAPGLAISAIIGATTNCHAFAPLPAGLVLDEGWRIRTSTIGMSANSDFSAIALTIVNYGS